MAVLYPNLCYNEVCHEETVLYILYTFTNRSGMTIADDWYIKQQTKTLLANAILDLYK